MAQVFNCPSCGASLDYEGDDDPVVRCPYCNSTVIVPECLLSQAHKQQLPAWTATTPPTASPLTIDLSGLTGKIATLKAVKQRVRDGQESEATRLYQEAFGASAEEAAGVVSKLASGQSVVISSGVFSTPIPVVSSRQAQVVSGEQSAEVLADQVGLMRQRQRKVNRVKGRRSNLILIAVLAIIVCTVVGIIVVACLF